MRPPADLKGVLTRLCCAKSFARFARNTDLGALPPVAPAGAVDKTPAHTDVWTAGYAGPGLDHRALLPPPGFQISPNPGTRPYSLQNRSRGACCRVQRRQGGASPRGSGGCRPPAEERHRRGRDAPGVQCAPPWGALEFPPGSRHRRRRGPPWGPCSPPSWGAFVLSFQLAYYRYRRRSSFFIGEMDSDSYLGRLQCYLPR